jgi:hypothetical protein
MPEIFAQYILSPETEVLDLARNGELSGVIPEELFAVSTLRSIDLGNNILFGPFPAEFALLTRLESLDLRNCFFSGVLPTELGLLTELRRLDIFLNAPLQGQIPSEFGLLTKLEVLVLADNAFSGMIPTELGSISTLQEMQLGRNGLTGAMPDEVCAVAGNPALALAILVVDCPDRVECSVPDCCSSCVTTGDSGLQV